MHLKNPALAGLTGIEHGFCLLAQGPSGVWRPRQVHGAGVVEAIGPDRVQADAVWSPRPGVRVGVVTADCVPILLAATLGPAVAAVHAGWRGLAAGVLEAALRTLGQAEPLETLVAAVGPSAGGCCYEVGIEVVDAVRPAPDRVAPSPRGRFLLDLAGVAEDRLIAAGLDPGRVARTGPCTICSPDWPSFRREGSGAGRLLAWIGRCTAARKE